LKSIVVVHCERKERAAAAGQTQTRLYLASAVWPPERAAALVRGHWGVENSLHWVMDMVFRDDHCRVRTGHAAENFVAVKHTAANIAWRNKGKESLRLTLKAAAWDDNHLAKLLAA
jgi:predicted transposase YbfD/YdcC